LTDSAVDAKKYAFRLLGYRSRSERELRERLSQKGFAENIIAGTLNYLKEIGYLDDIALAQNLTRQVIQDRLLGYSGARRFMLKRGLSREVIESTLEYDEDIELRNAKKLIDKKMKSMANYHSIREKKRLWNFLLRRGYSLSTANKVLKHYNFEKENG